MPLGKDTQYDLSWEEQDKVRRRQDIKKRLKREGVMKRFSPFMHMKGEFFTDPAVDRYSDLRKQGRVPGAPFKPSLFFGLVGLTVIPIAVIAYAVHWERRDWLRDVADGTIPYKDRTGKAVV